MRCGLVLKLLFSCCLLFNDCGAGDKQADRPMAVAGQFYPARPDDLKEMLENCFSKAGNNVTPGKALAIVSPHAGYVFSGVVAASSYNQIDRTKEYHNIFILASSHHFTYPGASLFCDGDYKTPLGKVIVNNELSKELIQKAGEIFFDRRDAHLPEHSIEVQLPFLQYILEKDFKIVPVIIGTEDAGICEKIASALKPYLTKNNLFIVSTDFSHYPQYEDAVKIDNKTTQSILKNSAEDFIAGQEAPEYYKTANLSTGICGYSSMLTLLYMTEQNKKIIITPVKYMNSGDNQSGGKQKVVGYQSLSFSEKQEFSLDDNDKKELLKIARSTIEAYIRNEEVPDIDESRLSDALREPCGAFVTLHEFNNLRGCIGNFGAEQPLYRVVQEMAVSSSTRDYRFPKVVPSEIDHLEIEISVLTPMKKINSADEFELGRHGIYIKKGNRSGTFLPQVAKETGWNKEEFLGYCARDKAGIGWDGWKSAELFTYEAIVFSEKELGIK